MDTTKQLKDLQDQFTRLQSQLGDLSSQVYKNNFSATQTFNKDVVFSSRLRVPVYSAAPTVAEVGDLICVSAKLYICTTASPSVFTLVGSQT